MGLEHLDPQCLNFTKPEKEMLMGASQWTFGVAGVARSGGLCVDKAGTALPVCPAWALTNDMKR